MHVMSELLHIMLTKRLNITDGFTDQVKVQEEECVVCACVCVCV